MNSSSLRISNIKALGAAEKGMAKGLRKQRIFVREQIRTPAQLKVGSIYRSWFKPKNKETQLKGAFQLLAVDCDEEELRIRAERGSELHMIYPAFEDIVSWADCSLWPYKPYGTWNDSNFITLSQDLEWQLNPQPETTDCQLCRGDGTIVETCTECSLYPIVAPNELKGRRLHSKYLDHDVYGYFACPYCNEQGKYQSVCPDCTGNGKIYLFPKSVPCGNCHGRGTSLDILCLRCYGFGGRLTFRTDIPMTAEAKKAQEEREEKKYIDFEKLECLWSYKD